MRLIAEDPEFTWSGTIFIVARVHDLRLHPIDRRGRHAGERADVGRLTIARALGAIGFMPLFVGAGVIMLPTVVGGGLAAGRTDWRRVLRVDLSPLLALGPVVLVGSQLVDSFGWSLHALLGFLAMLAIYGTIVAATRFTMEPRADGWKLKSSHQDPDLRDPRPGVDVRTRRNRHLARRPSLRIVSDDTSSRNVDALPIWLPNTNCEPGGGQSWQPDHQRPPGESSQTIHDERAQRNSRSAVRNGRARRRLCRWPAGSVRRRHR